ncbi:unnamed protein product [Caenorhabditis nigoni]
MRESVRKRETPHRMRQLENSVAPQRQRDEKTKKSEPGQRKRETGDVAIHKDQSEPAVAPEKRRQFLNDYHTAETCQSEWPQSNADFQKQRRNVESRKLRFFARSMVDRSSEGAAIPEEASITTNKNTLRDEKTNCDVCQTHPERLDGQIREISILAIFY